MILFWIIFIILFLSFGVIVFIGAPYVPSRIADDIKLFDELNLRIYSLLKNQLKKGSYVASYAFSFEGVKIYKKIEPINLYRF